MIYLGKLALGGNEFVMLAELRYVDVMFIEDESEIFSNGLLIVLRFVRES